MLTGINTEDAYQAGRLQDILLPTQMLQCHFELVEGGKHRLGGRLDKGVKKP